MNRVGQGQPAFVGCPLLFKLLATHCKRKRFHYAISEKFADGNVGFIHFNQFVGEGLYFVDGNDKRAVVSYK